MAITTLSMVLTVLVLNLHHISGDHPVPPWMKRVFLRHAACMLGGHLPAEKHRLIVKSTLENVEAEDGIVESANHTVQQMLEKEVGETPQLPQKERNIKEWKVVAEVLDRLFFWAFLVAIVLTTLSLLFRPLADYDISETHR
jgi:hypothetical protein